MAQDQPLKNLVALPVLGRSGRPILQDVEFSRDPADTWAAAREDACTPERVLARSASCGARTWVNQEPTHNGAFGEQVIVNSEF
jgi:hypothetical protein